MGTCGRVNRDNGFLPLEVDFINENGSVANPDPTPRIASIDSLSTLKMYLLNVGHRLFTITQTELNGKTMCQLQTTAFLLLSVEMHSST